MELEKFRRVAKLSATELADRSGVDLSIISRLEADPKRTASYATTVRLARALNLEPEELEPVDLRPGPVGKRRPPAPAPPAERTL